VPCGLRWCGYGGLSASARAVRYWLCLPGWLVHRAKEFQRVTRLPGGLWLLEETGEVLRSAWEFVRFDACRNASGFRKRVVVVDVASLSWRDMRVVGVDADGQWWLGNGWDAEPMRLIRSWH
jgi:hypothetical protein